MSQRMRICLSSVARFLSPSDPAASADGVPREDGRLAIWLFFRGLGLSFLFAFLSLWPQVLGLFGSRGILPVAPFLRAVSKQVGWERYVLLPSFFWLGSSDNALHFVCGLGLVCSLLLLVGVLEVVALLGAWLCYLSFVGVGRDFMGFQWDSLLLETALWSLPLALFRPRLRLQLHPVVPAGRWLLFWLLLRFMFAAGWAKLRSGDPVWRDLSALDYHFFTQPLPTLAGYYAHQLPSGLKKLATLIMFVIELAVPFAIFWPKARRVAALLLIALQGLIQLTGNFGFFNVLSAVLAIPLLPDAWLRRLLPQVLLSRLQARSEQASPSPSALPPAAGSEAASDSAAAASSDVAKDSEVAANSDVVPLAQATHAALAVKLAVAFRGVLFVALMSLSSVQALLMFLPEEMLPSAALSSIEYASVFHAANRYGLFAVMTKERPEIVIEGSLDGVNWVPYEFKYKPVLIENSPRINAPHQPRLDWQLWFLALRPYRRGGWFDGLCIRLLQGSPDVLWLFAQDPFYGRKPRQVRATLYRYEFTSLAERRQTGAYYKRSDPTPYIDPVSLP